MKTFKTRAISSIVFVAIMIVGLFGNPWLFLLLLLIIHAGCWVEYQSLIAAIDSTYRQISIFHKIGTYARAGFISRVHNIPFEEFKKELFKPLEYMQMSYDVLSDELSKVQ